MDTILVEPPPLNKNDIEKIVGTKIKNIDIYQRAFTHKSALKKYKLSKNFETIEFMGDSVLGFVITKMLFDKYESEQEGFLTKIRTKLVRGDMLANIARKLGFRELVLMDDKGIRHGWNNNDNVLEDVFEAFVGAIYLDLGMVHAKKFILDIFNNPQYVNMNTILTVDDNFKDQLMRYCQAQKIKLPVYEIIQHDNNIFSVSVSVNGSTCGIGYAKNKKKAEQEAAGEAIRELGI
jgi:ribonuclease-3